MAYLKKYQKRRKLVPINDRVLFHLRYRNTDVPQVVFLRLLPKIAPMNTRSWHQSKDRIIKWNSV